MTALAPTLQAFFTDRLIQQRQVSPATVAAYRDTFRLLLGFLTDRSGKAPSALGIEDLDAPTITAFLQHLELDRHNSARTRNARLAAIRSLFHYAAVCHPEHAAVIARVLAIPQKRFDKAIVSFLTDREVDALLDAPDSDRWEGRRDRTLLAVAIQTGLRVSEITGLNCGDLTLDAGAHLRCDGKGRKQRAVPLTAGTVAVLREWLRERGGLPAEPLFPTRTGRRLTRGAIERRVAVHATAATRRCPSLHDKQITPHVLRHTTAMALLHAGVDISVIALWLGHEDIRSTQMYLHADLAIKERALARVAPNGAKPGRYQPPDPLLAFLESL
ncbi:MAG: site-specific integrase [Pseudonocardiaceae bacterium]|nr:site-specific integrase [Pseudonocardiaceae bacterium]